MRYGREFVKVFKAITSLYDFVVTHMPNLEQKRQKVLSKIDQKAMDVLQKETKVLSLQEIANKTGEAPQKIAKSIWNLFVNNEKLVNEMLLQIYI